MVEAVKQENFRRDFATGASYVKFSDAPVAYTLQIKENDGYFVADYDKTGAVRGVEFVGSRTNTNEYYRTLATKHSKGPATASPREKRLP